MSLLRLDKYLTDCGCGTRSEVKKILKTGVVFVNGQQQKDGAQKIQDTDLVICAGKQLQYARYHYIILHKPAGCVTALKDNLHKTVMDYLPKEICKNLSPVGRLDLDTEGLLLLTDNGDLAHRLLSPTHHVPKTYYAQIDGVVSDADVERFAVGLDIGETSLTRPAVLKILHTDTHTSEIEVTITEGKFHQVKRMFQAVGTSVTYLKRLSMGSLSLDAQLQPGEWRYLTKEEEESLLKC